MSRKTKNTSKMWYQEGYRVVRNRYTQRGSDVLDMRLCITRIDGQKIEFKNEWDAIKKLAQRQEFYVYPMTESNEDEQAQVYLIKRDTMYQLPNNLRTVYKLLSLNYWVIQRDEEMIGYLQALERLHEWAKKMIRIQNTMSSKNSSGIHYMKDGRGYEEFDEFRDEFYYLTETMEKSEKISKNNMKVQQYYSQLLGGKNRRQP